MKNLHFLSQSDLHPEHLITNPNVLLAARLLVVEQWIEWQQQIQWEQEVQIILAE